MNPEYFEISKAAEEQFKNQQSREALGVPELTHREKVASLKSANQIIKSTKMRIQLFFYKGILFLSSGLVLTSLTERWVGEWSKVFWLFVIYGGYQLLITLVGFIFFTKSITQHPERVFIEENGQAIHQYSKNYGFSNHIFKVGVVNKEAASKDGFHMEFRRDNK